MAAMIKLKWSNAGHAGLQKALQYMTGTGQYAEKHEKDHVLCAPAIATPEKQAAFLEKFAEALEPKNGGRRSKRTALKLIISWPRKRDKKSMEVLEAFMKKHFEGYLWTWASHEATSKDGKALNHYHILVCPRHEEGRMLRVGKKEIAHMQSTFLTESRSRGMSTGFKVQSKGRSRPRRRTLEPEARARVRERKKRSSSKHVPTAI